MTYPDTPPDPSSETPGQKGNRFYSAILSFLTATAIPPATIYLLAKAILPGVPLAHGSLRLWLTLVTAGLVSFCLVFSRGRIRLHVAAAIGVAIGWLFLAVFLVVVNIWPRAAGAI